MFDIILFAAAAAFLAYRVYMVLGQKRHDETQRPNPFQRREEQAKPPHKRDDAAEDSPDLSPLALPGNLDLDGEAPPKPFAKLDAAPGSLAGTLAQIKNIDRTFDEKEFVGGAKEAFKIIVGAFARGDKGMLRTLLSERVYQQFATAIEAREKQHLTQTTDVVSIAEAGVTTARLEGGKAYITVAFTSQQRNHVKNAAGETVEGDARRAEDIADTWTFMRDLHDTDPNWILVETRAA